MYKCQQLKSTTKIHFKWFFNNAINIKLTKHGRIQKINCVNDIEKSIDLLKKDSLEEHINPLQNSLNTGIQNPLNTGIQNSLYLI